jgi:broad specificity phosphatase PhoE
MLKIYLARHGQNEDNAKGILNGHRDLPLTPKGVEQAEEVAREIAAAQMGFTHIYASPLSRAFTTAEIIARAIGGPTPEVEELLIERDFGVMTGVEQSRIKELCAPDVIQAELITYFLSPEVRRPSDLVERGSDYSKSSRASTQTAQSCLSRMVIWGR